tara:strand:- start:1373 stop:2470 length:1098 start_codon:yes stop_codon:yes gene_type:complete
MTFKLGNNAYLFEEDGKVILVAKTIKHEGGAGGSMVHPSVPSVGVTIKTGTIGTLPEGYIDDAFFTFQGSTSGYASGGRQNFSVWMTKIDKYPFSSDTNASDVGDLSQARDGAGQSSAVNGYTAGGSQTSFNNYVNFIDKFPFSISSGTASDVGDLTVARAGHAGQSSGSNGYVTGGSPYTDVIDKFPVSSDANATDIGNLTAPRAAVSGQSSTTHGYTSGSLAFPTFSGNIIDKFPFAVNGNATDVGDLVKPTMYGSASTGQSSTSHGYHSGGISTPPYIAEDTIQKFTFASDNDATDVGNLTIARQSVSGQSSTTHGYATGGYNNPPQVFYNTIEKFTFTSDNDATDVGDMTVEGFHTAGQQV